MNDLFEFVAGDDDVGRRVDVVLASHLPTVSRSMSQQLVRDRRVHVNGECVRPSQRVSLGDRIKGQIVLRPSFSAAPEQFPLVITYHDQDLAVIDKPAGLVVHPAPGHESGTLANALAALFPQSRQVGTDGRPGIVHRLDKDTSGLMVVALNAVAHASLQMQIGSHQAARVYLALASGDVQPASGIIDAPVGRDRDNRKRMAVHGAAARPARTSYRVLERLAGFSLLEARLESGRTHQIRVHFAVTGHPLAGDTVYGGPRIHGLGRQFLHASQLILRSPTTGESLEFTSPLPPELETVLGRLREGQSLR